MEKIELCGVGIHPLTQNLAVEQTLAAIKERKSFRRPPFLIFTPNAAMLGRALKEPSLAKLLNRADLSLPDGSGTCLAAGLLGHPLPERVPGIEFAEELMARLAAAGGSVYLLGGKPGVAAQAAEKLSARYPGLVIAGCHDGYFGDDELPALLCEIRDAAPDFLAVCLGFPKQESFLCLHAEELTGVGAGAGLGGCLDVFSGELKRAPHLFRQLRLEWLWRCLIEPNRFIRLRPVFTCLFFCLRRGVSAPASPPDDRINCHNAQKMETTSPPKGQAYKN